MVRLCYSIYKVQFCSFLDFVVRSELLYSSTECFVCQELFSFFSNFFLFSVLPAGRSSGNLNMLSQMFSFVKTFLHLFSNFFCSLSSRQAVHQTAGIYYHSLIVLSSTNFTFFDLFCTSSFRHRSTTLLLISASASAASETLLSC